MHSNSRPLQFCVLLFALTFTTILKAQDTKSTVKIGDQIWMSKNLNVATFRNGDVIPEARSTDEWEKAYMDSSPAWCYYDNDAEYGPTLGKMYNWFAVNDPRGLAPKGYHVPSKAEWDSLMIFLGGQSMAGKKLKSKEGWPDGGNGTNESGFSGLPGGMRYYNGLFGKTRKFGHWWTSTPLPPFYAWQYYLLFSDDGIGFYSYDFGKGAGMSVRCLKD